MKQEAMTTVLTGMELDFSDADFTFIASLVKESLGIVLGSHKKSMVYRRLVKRIRELGYRDFKQYCDKLSSDINELKNLANAISTNLTSFFREKHHFEYLEKLLDSLLLTQKSLRIWSAGCSNGCEPYTIAMVVRNHKLGANCDLKILATDIDTDMLDTGSRGLYPDYYADKIPQEYRKYVTYNPDGSGQILPAITSDIHFKRLNLLEKWPISRQFDVIFCRNVVIYFDKDTQRMLFDRFADALGQNGHLFIGHSETLNKVCNRFDSIGHTIYKKIN